MIARRLAWLGPILFAAVWAWPTVEPGAKSSAPDEQAIKAIYIAGDFQGNLAPCGCSSPMLGGIQRLGSALALTPKSQRIFLVNGGLLPSNKSDSVSEVRQLQMKAETFAEVFGALGVSAINLGVEEASRGSGVVEAIGRLSGQKLISASVDGPSIPPIVRVGNFTVVGLTAQPEALGSALGFPSRSLADALDTGLIGPSARLIVLLRGDEPQARALAESTSRAEVIVYQTQGTPPAPEKVGNALLVSPGSEGRAILRIDVDGQTLSSPSVITLTPDFRDAPLVTEMYHLYLKRVESENLLGSWPRSKTSPFAGSATCQPCHKEEFKVWKASSHSHAYADLVARGHSRDPDCVSCHVTGLSSTRGFKSLALTPKLANVTCESCHGPGSEHAHNPRLIRLPKLTEESCLKCHTSDNSPRFDVRMYWPKIAHGHTPFSGISSH